MLSGLTLSLPVLFSLTSSPATSLTTLTSVFEQIVSWIISFLSMISSEPLLLIGLAVMVAGMIIGLAFRAIRGGRRR